MLFPFSLPEPHDARVRAQLLSSARHASLDSTTSAPPLASPIESRNPLESSRARRQFSLFAAGAIFVGLSALITRRALVRKYNEIRPAGIFSPSNNVPAPSGGWGDGAEAAGLASVNVLSVTWLLGAGALWAAARR